MKIDVISVFSDYNISSKKSNNYEWIENNHFVVHAMGSVAGKRVTNSLEAFESNYDKGIRLFEVDLMLTSDNFIVARHDWLAYLAVMLEQDIPGHMLEKPLSYSEFRKLKINQKFNPLGLEDIIQLMISHEDAFIITDTKDIDKENILKKFDIIDELLSHAPATVRKRVIPQVYDKKMYKLLKKNYDFSSYIFTTYNSLLTENEIVEFAHKNDIRVVSVTYTKCTKSIVDKLGKYDIYTFVHTINHIEQIEEFEKMGVYGFYTDYLKP